LGVVAGVSEALPEGEAAGAPGPPTATTTSGAKDTVAVALPVGEGLGVALPVGVGVGLGEAVGEGELLAGGVPAALPEALGVPLALA
jgi:hypothetical protein